MSFFSKNLKFQDQDYLEICLALAEKAAGHTSPNPMVGAVLVKNQKIIGQGFHAKAGQDHAEVAAFKNASDDVANAVLYCSLEPCCHTHKKTPPCTQLILEKKISKVVYINDDPNPQVSGNGAKILSSHGVQVTKTSNVQLQKKEKNLNKVFYTNQLKKRPYYHLKWAQTANGMLCDLSQKQKWISGKEAQLKTHHLRGLYDGILIGLNTALIDRPQLNVRLGLENLYPNPRPIILGKKEKLPPDHPLLAKNPLFYAGELADLSDFLISQNISSVLVEGGAKTLAKFLETNLFDEIDFFQSSFNFNQGLTIKQFFSKTNNTIFSQILFEQSPLGDDLNFHFQKEL